jgi:hypothetical protein
MFFGNLVLYLAIHRGPERNILAFSVGKKLFHYCKLLININAQHPAPASLSKCRAAGRADPPPGPQTEAWCPAVREP